MKFNYINHLAETSLYLLINESSNNHHIILPSINHSHKNSKIPSNSNLLPSHRHLDFDSDRILERDLSLSLSFPRLSTHTTRPRGSPVCIALMRVALLAVCAENCCCPPHAEVIHLSRTRSRMGSHNAEQRSFWNIVDDRRMVY